MAARTARFTSSFVSASKRNRRQRDTMAGVMAIMGFSVVEPIKRMVPASIAGRMESDCALLQRWHSSNKRYVGRPYMERRLSAALMTSRTSATPLVTALSLTNSLRVWFAMMEASVVLPVPGGPQKMELVSRSASIARRNSRPGPTMASCPMNSCSVRGRMRSASGASFWFCERS